jgi:bifunctional lysine-specific demethylase and histidyl-hydroxylase NO66
MPMTPMSEPRTPVTPETEPSAAPAAVPHRAPVATLDRCVGDVAWFERNHWARAPLLRQGADPQGFADLFRIADVDHLVTSTALRAPAFRLVRDGKPLPIHSYTRNARIGSRPVNDLADPGRVLDHFAEGATIVLQSLHRYWPPLARFRRDLELILTHPVQVNAYITPPASRGLGVHHDGHDVFVLQVYGRKQWDVYATGDEAGAGQRLVSAELAPGDALYIPRTFPHAARTAEAASCHLTVGVLTTTWRDLLRRAVDDALSDAAFAEPLPVGFADRPDELASAVSGRLRSLATRLDTLDASILAEGAAARFWSNRPPPLAGQLSQLLELDRIGDHTTVRRRPGVVCRLQPEDGRVALRLGDREVRLPGRLEPVLRWMLDRHCFTVGDLAEQLDDESRIVLIRRLVREGLLEAERD